jgi:ornithine cyclodeaminase
MPLLLNEADVARCLDMKRLIPLMRETLGRFSRGECVQPVRTSLRIEPALGFYGVMPAHVPGPGDDPGAFGLKSVCFFPGNDAKGLHTHMATVLILDPRTGALEAIMDGRLITEMRTAAVSAVSADLLAAKGPVTLAILGSGVQARSHLEAMNEVRELGQVRVWSRREEHARRFAQEMQSRVRCALTAVSTVKAAMRGAQLVVTATSAIEPIVTAADLEPGMHLAVVGSSDRTRRELDGPAVARCRVWVDTREAARVEAGDIVLAIEEGAIRDDHVIGELGDVINGTSGRAAPDEITMFKSLGMAVEDVASGRMIVESARAQGIGRDIDI